MKSTFQNFNIPHSETFQVFFKKNFWVFVDLPQAAISAFTSQKELNPLQTERWGEVTFTNTNLNMAPMIHLTHYVPVLPSKSTDWLLYEDNTGT